MPSRTADEFLAPLRAVLEPELGPGLQVEDLRRVAGGSSRQTWTFTVRRQGGGSGRYVLRRDPPGSPSSGVRLEGGLLAAAAGAGVPVPSVVAAGDADAGLGAAFVVMEFVEGETIPRRILRDEALAPVRPRLAAQCGAILAAIHRIPPASVPGLAAGDQLEAMRGLLDALGQPHPAFELGIRWLAANRPPRSDEVVVHGDFRNGNLIVGPDGVRAVLDWELAHIGDPIEDLGWLCVKAWRFGSPLPVGGFGPVQDLVSAYEEASGRRVDPAALHWWEVLGTLRWGVISIVQAMTHMTGVVRSVELAAIGRRVCEVEWDLLDAIGSGLPAPAPDSAPRDEPTDAATAKGAPTPAAPPHDVPAAADLLDAVREFLESEVVVQSEGRLRFHALVAANVVGMVAREMAIGPAQASAHAARLAHLGVADDAALALAIRSGSIDDRIDEVHALVRASVADKLAVANPSYPRTAEATASGGGDR